MCSLLQLRVAVRPGCMLHIVQVIEIVLKKLVELSNVSVGLAVGA